MVDIQTPTPLPRTWTGTTSNTEVVDEVPAPIKTQTKVPITQTLLGILRNYPGETMTGEDLLPLLEKQLPGVTKLQMQGSLSHMIKTYAPYVRRVAHNMYLYNPNPTQQEINRARIEGAGSRGAVKTPEGVNAPATTAAPHIPQKNSPLVLGAIIEVIGYDSNGAAVCRDDQGHIYIVTVI